MPQPCKAALQALAGKPAIKLLLVSWYFPPANAVAAIRLDKMARYLERNGHQPRVITSNLEAEDQSLEVEVDPTTVIRTSSFSINDCCLLTYNQL